MNKVVEVLNVSKIYTENNYILGVRSILKLRSKKEIKGYKALDNISLNIQKGEAFGIIGRNGSGKSTLLQIIAGTLIPTTGTINTFGRVSALLELGSGFNPEFTGIENIYLAGSILGISKVEMDLKVSNILDFADIGDFINKPVKTYSTGMLMRVAFAVAISTEPDLLIIDEALSVGDILFQQKCSVRLKELLNKGVTLLVVTHDTSFVLNLCRRALWLHKGQMRYLGDASICVQQYLAEMASASGNEIAARNLNEENSEIILPEYRELDTSHCKVIGESCITLSRIWLLNNNRTPTSVFNSGDWCEVVLEVFSRKNLEYVSAGCELRDRYGQVMFATGLRVVKKLIRKLSSNEKRLVSLRFQLNLAPAQYTIDVGCGAGEGLDNTGYRILAVSIIDVIVNPEDEVIHGLVKLPYEVRVSSY